MQEWLINLVTDHQYLVYVIMWVTALVEGPILSMIAGILLRLDYFPLIPLFLTLMLGDLAGDVLWYGIGRHYGHRFTRRFGKYFSITEGSVNKVEKLFHKHHYYILFASKVTNGLGFALVTLMVAGMVKIPFWKYFIVNAVGQFFWTGILLGIGYFFGHIYTQIDGVLGKLSIAALLIIAFLALLGYKKYLKTRAEKLQL